MALKWAEQTEEERKQWALKAEAVCASSIQELVASSQPAPLGLSSLLSPAMASDLGGTGSLVEKALLGIQEKARHLLPCYMLAYHVYLHVYYMIVQSLCMVYTVHVLLKHF